MTAYRWAIQTASSRSMCSLPLPSMASMAHMRLSSGRCIVVWQPSVINSCLRFLKAPRVLIPVATKVLHRKRPALIPMLDNVVLAHYLRTLPNRLPGATQDKARAAGIAIEALGMFRADLEAVQPEVAAVVAALASAGFSLSPVRTLEILLWTEIEERGYYREASATTREA
jgi:Family of unknown function (DUF6308)